MQGKINWKKMIIIYTSLLIVLIIFFTFVKQRNGDRRLVSEVQYMSLQDANVEVVSTSEEEDMLLRIEVQEHIQNAVQGNRLAFRLDTISNDQDNNISKIEYLVYEDNTCIISMKNNEEEKTMIGTINTDIDEVRNMVIKNAKDVLIIDEDGFTYGEGFKYYDNEDNVEYFLSNDKDGYKEIEDVIYKSKFKQQQVINILRSKNE